MNYLLCWHAKFAREYTPRIVEDCIYKGDVITCNIYDKLTPLSRVFLEKLTGSQLVKKFPAFYGNPPFITAFTSARHLSLSSARSIQSMLSHLHLLKIHLIIILPSMPGSSKWFFSSSFPTKTLYTPLLSLIRATCPTHLILLDLITQKIWRKWFLHYTKMFIVYE